MGRAARAAKSIAPCTQPLALERIIETPVAGGAEVPEALTGPSGAADRHKIRQRACPCEGLHR